MTLRRRLLLLLLPALALLMFLGGLVDYWVATATTQDAYDQALAATARTAGAYLNGQPDTPLSVSVPRLGRVLSSEAAGSRDALVYVVSDAHGRTLVGSAALCAILPGLAASPGKVALGDARLGGMAVRVAALQLLTPDGAVRVGVAEPTARRARTQHVMLFGKLMVDFAELDLTLLLIWIAVYFGLKPLSRLEARAEQQATRRLQRFDVTKVPGELRSLVVAFNRVLELLQDAASAQRRFVADAAHQMRTPVAGLLAQIELLIQDPRAHALAGELATLQRGTQSLARSANQLLALARAEPVTALHADFQPIALDALIKDLVERHLDRADQAGIDLGADTAPVVVAGDAWLMEDLIGNLIDNALKYTPRGGHVTVRSGEEAGHPYIEIEDDGPGIPEPERQRVRERFYRRPGSPGIGAGLGLAIVDEIARVHEASFSIGSGAQGRGARMHVRFARPPIPDITLPS
ncbi:MAG TPA: ATP-binding protein [Steroidobacteraceae bacterium]|nr:ATP-binding protein [Steroidobacteraceae bacterium]